jgi:hypothetical protein
LSAELPYAANNNLKREQPGSLQVSRFRGYPEF